jgi:hypothetical protein
VVKKRAHKAEQHHEDNDGDAHYRELVSRKGAEDKLRDAALLVYLPAIDFG